MQVGRSTNPMQLRLPDYVKDALLTAIRESGRSQNAEIVYRLRISLGLPAEAADDERRQRQVKLRLPVSVVAALQADAEASGRSMSAEIEHRLKAVQS